VRVSSDASAWAFVVSERNCVDPRVGNVNEVKDSALVHCELVNDSVSSGMVVTSCASVFMAISFKP
jgi:hypothetical protein